MEQQFTRIIIPVRHPIKKKPDPPVVEKVVYLPRKKYLTGFELTYIVIIICLMAFVVGKYW